jgi:hypothetical protein
LKQHLLDALTVGVQHREQNFLFRLKKEVNASGIRFRLPGNFSNGCRLITLLGEQAHGSSDDPLLCIRWHT